MNALENRKGLRPATLRRYLKALLVALHDPETPFAARLCARLTIAYALSPIDLIPDFIPLLGYLDDALIIPLGVLLTKRLIPPPVWERSLERAEEVPLPDRSIIGALLVTTAWVVVLAGAGWFLWWSWGGPQGS